VFSKDFAIRCNIIWCACVSSLLVVFSAPSCCFPFPLSSKSPFIKALACGSSRFLRSPSSNSLRLTFYVSVTDLLLAIFVVFSVKAAVIAILQYILFETLRFLTSI
jgi:hypothetical protein